MAVTARTPGVSWVELCERCCPQPPAWCCRCSLQAVAAEGSIASQCCQGSNVGSQVPTRLFGVVCLVSWPRGWGCAQVCVQMVVVGWWPASAGWLSGTCSSLFHALLHATHHVTLATPLRNSEGLKLQLCAAACQHIRSGSLMQSFVSKGNAGA